MSEPVIQKTTGVGFTDGRPASVEASAPGQERTADLLATELAIRKSPAVWFATCGHILNKERRDEQPVPNIFQCRMSAAHEWQVHNGLPSRQIDLKPRQVGGTTFGAAILYHAMRTAAMRGVAIADCLDHSNNLFAMLTYYGMNDDFPWGSEFSHTQMDAEMSNGSVCEKKTAERPTSTRSSTLQGLLASEVGWWPNTPAKSAGDTLLSLGNSLASAAGTVGIEESTPNGAAGAFADDWRGARWPEYDDYWKIYGMPPDVGQGNGYIRVFAAWYEFLEYEKSLGGTEGEITAAIEKLKGQADVSADERADEAADIVFIKAVLARSGVTDEAEMERTIWRKIAWRRWCVRDKDRCRGDLEKFKQEYPSDPVSCFLHSGKPRFNNEGLVRLEEMARRTQPLYGVLDEQTNGAVVFRKTSKQEAWLHVWEEPMAGCHYCMPVDPMTGADQTTGSVDPDHNSVGVLRRGYVDTNGVKHNKMLVARIAPPNTMDAGPLMDMGAKLARWYGNCIVIPEVNKGLHVLERCKMKGLTVYRRSSGVDRAREEVTERLGWQTDGETRLQIIDTLGDDVRRNEIDIYCPVAVAQMRTFVRNKNGRPEAAPGCKDDDVLMLAIGDQCLPGATRYREPARRRVKFDADDYQ